MEEIAGQIFMPVVDCWFVQGPLDDAVLVMLKLSWSEARFLANLDL